MFVLLLLYKNSILIITIDFLLAKFILFSHYLKFQPIQFQIAHETVLISATAWLSIHIHSNKIRQTCFTKQNNLYANLPFSVTKITAQQRKS